MAPFTVDSYVGMTVRYFLQRKRLHRTSGISPHKKERMDFCHGQMLKQGFYKFLFGPHLDCDVTQPTRIEGRRAECREMWLLRANLNTVGNSTKGMRDFRVLD